jgi:hypothetical protein
MNFVPNLVVDLYFDHRLHYSKQKIENIKRENETISNDHFLLKHRRGIVNWCWWLLLWHVIESDTCVTSIILFILIYAKRRRRRRKGNDFSNQEQIVAHLDLCSLVKFQYRKKNKILTYFVEVNYWEVWFDYHWF